MRSKLAILIVVVGLSAASFASASAVVHSTSQPVSGVKFSWVVSIHSTFEGDRDQQICTGALIDDFTVVTAAHCLVALADQDWVIVQGRAKSDDRGRVLTAFDAQIHPQYDPITSNNDIALIYLYYPAYSSEHLTLASASKKFLSEPLYLFGWGNSENGQNSDQLRRAPQKLAPQSAIDKFFDSYDAKNQIAARWYDKERAAYAGACQGDSGGPLVKKIDKVNYLVGVVSYGARECNTAAPTVYTKVSQYRNWLSVTKSASKVKHASGISIAPYPFFVTGGKFLPVTELANATAGASLQTTVRLVTGDLPNNEIDISSLTVNSYSTVQKYGSVSLTASNVGAWDACSLTSRGFIEVRIDVDGKLGSDRIWQYGDLETGCITDGAQMIMVKSVPNISDQCQARIQTTSKGPQVWFTAECFGTAKTALFRMLLADGEAADVEPGSDNWMGPVVLKR